MRLHGTLGTVALVITIFLVGLQTNALGGDIRYTKYNIHTQAARRGFEASYANYNYFRGGSGHMVIPMNTQIEIMRTGRGGFVFRLGEGRTCEFDFDARRMNMTVQAYIDLITSPGPVSTAGFSEIDMRGIKDGTAYRGMRRAGVLAALGYPARHKTPSLESDSWIYWKSKSDIVTVQFDPKGKVIADIGTPVAYVKVVQDTSRKVASTPVPTYENVKIIDVLIKGIDDGVKASVRQDRDEAMLDAKLQAIERAGVKIDSLTQVENFTVKKDMVEQQSKAVLMPGFQIVDSGYQRDGTYLIILSGKIKLIEQRLEGE
jgi:hypothetical protein